MIGVVQGPSLQLTNQAVVMSSICTSSWYCAWNVILYVAQGPSLLITEKGPKLAGQVSSGLMGWVREFRSQLKHIITLFRSDWAIRNSDRVMIFSGYLMLTIYILIFWKCQNWEVKSNITLTEYLDSDTDYSCFHKLLTQFILTILDKL